MADRFGKRIELALRRSVVRTLRAIRRRPGNDVADLAKAKYLFIRQDMLGDVLVSTALFSALKTRYPDATLDAVLSPKNHLALANNPNIRRKWIYNKTLSGTIQLIRNIRLERYDFVIDLMDNPSATSTILCMLAGAGLNVGLDKENGYAYDIRVPLLSRRDSHIIDRLGELLRPFGIDPKNVDLHPQYWPGVDAEAFAEGMFERLGIHRSPVLGINISAGTETRFWGIANYAALVHSLSDVITKGKLLILYKPADASRAQAIASQTGAMLCKPTPSFDHFAAVIRRLSFLVTPDTSAVHLASAFRLPAVVLYVQSNPDLRIWDPYLSPSRTIVTSVDDLKTIPVERVLNEAKELLRETKPEFGVVQ